MTGNSIFPTTELCKGIALVHENLHFQQVRQEFAKHNPLLFTSSSHPFVNFILKVCKIQFFFHQNDSKEINVVKPAIRKETSAAIWLCEDYNEIKLDIYNTKSLLNVLSLQFHHCISDLSRREVAELCYQTRQSMSVVNQLQILCRSQRTATVLRDNTKTF